MAAKEDLIYKSLEIDPARVRWCKKVNEDLRQAINKKKPKTLEQLADLWYSGYGFENRERHYHTTVSYTHLTIFGNPSSPFSYPKNCL